jgi:hypothetical protein
MSALLQNSFSLSNLSHNVDKGNSGSLVEAVAVGNAGGGGGGGGGMVAVVVWAAWW